MIGFVNRKRIMIVFAVLVALVLIILVVWMLIAGPTTVLRILRYGDTNIDDFSHYPGRALTPAPAPSPLPRAEGALQLPAAMLSMNGAAMELDTLLAANDTIAFLVVQDGVLIDERYFQEHGPASLSQLFSVSKSVTSALVGMAIADGYMEGVAQPITDFIPELADRGFDAVTIHHLLTMMSGSSYQENDNPFGEHVILNYTPRLEERILRFQMETEPGAVHRYKSGDNALLALALARALQPETITEYAQRRLWTPLGMEDQAVWTIDHEGDGLEKTWCCLATSARDLAKLGQLYLNEGAWAGAQLLPASWIERSTGQGYVPEEQWSADYRAAGWRNYGYQWWLASESDGDYFALGKDGQFLYVNPATNSVVVRLGWSQGELASGRWIALFQAVAQAARP